MTAVVATVRTEWRIVSRARLPVVAAVLVAMWALVVRQLPSSIRDEAVALALFADIAGLCLLAVPALIVGERTTGTDLALRTTPQPAVERIAVRMVVMAALAIGAGVTLVLVTGPDALLWPVAGVTTMTLLFAALAYVVTGSTRTLTGFMTRLPVVAVPLILPALVSLVGPGEMGWLRLSPVTDQLTLMRGNAIGPWAWAWQLAWLMGSVWWASRPTATAPGTPTVPPTRRRSPPQGSWLLPLRSRLWVDRAVIGQDPLALMVLVGVPLTAVAARLATGVGVEWVSAEFGVDLTSFRPAAWALLVVVHTPVLIGSVTGLLLLEDRDAGMWPVVATTRSSLRGLVAYRCALASAATAVLTLAGLWIGGASHDLGVAGVASTAVAAAALAPLPAVAMGATARDRTQGVAVLKLLGLPFYLPVALWWVEEPLRILALALPSAWTVEVFWATSPTALAATSTGAVALPLGLTLLLSRRLLRRVPG